MRIITGTLKGREFKSPHGHKTHPMSDKVRGAMFNVLGDVEGLSILDSFAGSGALAFEAVSRGAKSVVAIDKDSAAHRILELNAKELAMSQVKVVKANAAGWSLHNAQKKFDIVILDPPYEDLQPNLMEKLIKRHLKEGGIAVLSYPGREKLPVFDKTVLAANKNYGDAQLAFYRKI